MFNDYFSNPPNCNNYLIKLIAKFKAIDSVSHKDIIRAIRRKQVIIIDEIMVNDTSLPSL